MNTDCLSGACRLLLLVGLQCVPLVAQSEPLSITLGTGHLGAGAFGLFNFTLAHNVGVGDVLRVGTTGSNFDTEIAIYDNQGRLVAANDDMGPRNPLSQLSFGEGQALAAGDYTVVLSGFNTLFRDHNIVPGVSHGGDFRLSVQTTQPVVTPLAPSQLAADGQILPYAIEEKNLGQGWLDARSVRRFDFTLENDVLAGNWLAIHTTGSHFDTEIGLYDAQGTLVATNDDIAPRNMNSRLSFGLDGDHGQRLLAGAYTLLLGGFNTIFDDDLRATSSLKQSGEYAVYLQLPRSGTKVTTGQAPHTVPEPSAIFLTSLGLVLLLLRKR